MSSCSAPNYPNCAHRCEGDVCIAIYEPETGLCIRGCNEAFLNDGIVNSLIGTGWSSKTAGSARQVRGFYFGLMAASVRLLASNFSDVKGVLPAQLASLASRVEALAFSAGEKRFDLSWQRSSISELLNNVSGLLGGEDVRGE